MQRLLIAAVALFALSGAALAQDITAGHLDALDANDDGAVDATEFDAYMVAAFKTAIASDTPGGNAAGPAVAEYCSHPAIALNRSARISNIH